MAPVVHGLENKYGDIVRFTYLDIDDPATRELQQAVGYSSAWRPYIMILDGAGNLLYDDNGLKLLWIGVIPGETLELGIQAALSQ